MGGPPKIMGKPPKPSILIGFSIIFTIHFGVPLFLDVWNRWILDAKHTFRHAVKHHIHTLLWDKPSGQGQTLLFKHGLGYFSFWYNGSNDISWFSWACLILLKPPKKMAWQTRRSLTRALIDRLVHIPAEELAADEVRFFVQLELFESCPIEKKMLKKCLENNSSVHFFLELWLIFLRNKFAGKHWKTIQLASKIIKHI